jgi:hypothetical protein
LLLARHREGALEIRLRFRHIRLRRVEGDDKLTTRLFKTGTRGFCAPEDASVAVCVLPGTELSFTEEVRRLGSWPWSRATFKHRTAIFRQINKEVPSTHHDALEFPDGKIVLLTFLEGGLVVRCGQPYPS